MKTGSKKIKDAGQTINYRNYFFLCTLNDLVGAFQVALSSKEPACQCRWRRKWQPTPVLLPGISHGWRSLVGYNPWGHKESDTTEQLDLYISLSCTGEGNGNPLQYSCLENPRYGGAWWAAVYGVTQSQTPLT